MSTAGASSGGTLHSINHKTTNRDAEPGWPIQDDEVGTHRPRAVSVVPAPSPTKWMSMDDIDDGWFLPEEPAAVAAPAPTPEPAPAGPVDLNRAGADELCSVPGVGPSRAERILALRDSRGRFTSVDDLAAVKGIGAKTLEQLRPHFTV